ncbi:SDR family oxidoreductase [Carnobacterium inhibens]|jgi:NAD(P)H dehydrogenase (quinone)|uniref:NAD(P)H-binding protein n=1 Tax=Carnobacterium inhibens TaxID=147709 RepID=A0ABR7TD31_9LACT|nr:SDR family oxidoreductase [Carnobacterium inhibens]MBC9825427.1 NAD(P)H-binding protein [Carnobacterium inhibens]MCM3512146.1 SDR family oxidoreductase [Carnobacterium inhibens]
MNYLLTGATGELGTYALHYLKEQVDLTDIVALARTEEKAAKLREQGIEVRIADFSDYTSLVKAFNGVDRMLFVSSQPGGVVSRDEQHKNVVNAAIETGVSFIAYTSFPKGATSNSPLAQDHILTEKLISESHISHTFLRNNWYLENEADTLNAAVAGHAFTYSAENGKTGWALKREFAEAAINVLTEKAAAPEILELSGTPITYAELAEALKTASGKEFEVVAMNDEDYQAALISNGVPEAAVSFILMIQNDIRNGELNVTSEDFEKALGKSLTPLVDALKEFLKK